MNPPWDTPPNGDFVRYIEGLHAKQAPQSTSSLLPLPAASPAPMRPASTRPRAGAAAEIGTSDLPPGAQELLAQWRSLKTQYAPRWLPRPLVPAAALVVLAGVLYLLWEGGGPLLIFSLVLAWLNWQKLQKPKSDRHERQARQRQVVAEALRHLKEKNRS